MNKTKIIKQTVTADESATQHQQFDTELQLIDMLRKNTDILRRHPQLLVLLEVPHESGTAVSLIERQVAVLRQKLQTEDSRLRELMAVARDNERLAKSRHRLALNLLAARDLDDVTSIVLDVLSNELAADHAVIKLFCSDEQKIEKSAGLFVAKNDSSVTAFKTMLQEKNTICGRATAEQKTFLFADSANSIASVAVIPLVAGADLGLIGLGANNAERFRSSMGTDFLSQIGELISASLAVHLEH